MFLSLLVTAALALSPAPQAAQAAAPSATPAQPAATEKTCRKFIPTGSIMPKRFCFTKAEWAEFDARTQAGAEGFLGRRTAGSALDKD
ncbi:hypothetical protein OMW55_05520 [Sphingomonas sp. BN140010]|uniref:YARHG domain-containing protein n=1 Tax=Sphingomonas arvum TaxID=2992113 RepID=A0ABT3JE06_9SPHN|nr:hypothetical protein [Sphingomonas sp. BN140010]MCW3797266.1 hypothetical protein [Sphingomonas sp. BN140010]